MKAKCLEKDISRFLCRLVGLSEINEHLWINFYMGYLADHTTARNMAGYIA